MFLKFFAKLTQQLASEKRVKEAVRQRKRVSIYILRGRCYIVPETVVTYYARNNTLQCEISESTQLAGCTFQRLFSLFCTFIRSLLVRRFFSHENSAKKRRTPETKFRESKESHQEIKRSSLDNSVICFHTVFLTASKPTPTKIPTHHRFSFEQKRIMYLFHAFVDAVND